MAFQADCVVVWKVDVAGSHGIGKRAVKKIVILVFILAIMKEPRDMRSRSTNQKEANHDNLRYAVGAVSK